jgi:hypothetical protein
MHSVLSAVAIMPTRTVNKASILLFGRVASLAMISRPGSLVAQMSAVDACRAHGPPRHPGKLSGTRLWLPLFSARRSAP